MNQRLYNFSFFFIFLFFFYSTIFSQETINVLKSYDVVWNSQSVNSSESMPCGGGDIGLNVWVEKGDLLFYLSRSGTFDENNGFLKLGRVRVQLFPNPFVNGTFRQELKLHEGYVTISGKNKDLEAEINLWVDVFRPVIHVTVSSSKPVVAEAIFESWRYADHLLRPGESFANSLKWGPVKKVTTLKDSINFIGNGVCFYHRNLDSTVFDITVRQQGLMGVKTQMYNPLQYLTFGGNMEGVDMKPSGIISGKYLDTKYKGWILKSAKPSRTQDITISLFTKQTIKLEEWHNGLANTILESEKNRKKAWDKTREWWNQFWDRSYILDSPLTSSGNKGIESNEWISKNGSDSSIFRNYQLFRYMLGCNAYGEYPTKFNGGLFTYDPYFTDTSKHFTPDYRNWCGGVMTAQNQRLVYFPMLKNGDFDLMKPQFDFYLHALRNAELRSEVYWGHKGACFAEQLENFGLPNSAEYGWNRPVGSDKGVEYNAWLEYEWDTVLEFCFMILEQERYTGKKINEYLPLIKSCLMFFNEHYQYLAKQRGAKTFDSDGHLILFPGSGAETFKMAYNATSTIAALKTVLSRLLELPDGYLMKEEKADWTLMLQRIPPISFREFQGHTTISPAKLWERTNNVESPQLYPVFPWGIYGVGKPNLEVALNTWNYDTLAIKFRSHIGWKQDNIWAARLGLTDEAFRLTVLKLGDSGRRFPTFWGPGFDWTPDHNWGGSAMIGLQEMLLQVDGEKIYLFPAWPKNKDVHFKLHAPYNTTVEAIWKNDRLELLKVVPESRKKDVILMIDKK